jgi:hypothetical protein
VVVYCTEKKIIWGSKKDYYVIKKRMKIGIAGNVSLWVSYGWRVDMIPIAV